MSLLGDAANAFLKAPMPGPEVCWLQLDPFMVPQHAKHIKNPCVPLDGALYGHPRAGAA